MNITRLHLIRWADGHMVRFIIIIIIIDWIMDFIINWTI